jgi:hypothetical protein
MVSLAKKESKESKKFEFSQSAILIWAIDVGSWN